MKILFVSLSNLEFNVETPYHAPLGGTESAVAYLTPELVKLGHDVTLMANTPEHVCKGVKHRPVSENIAEMNPDVVVAVSAPQAVPSMRTFAPNAKVVLWNHMMPDQPAMAPLNDPECTKFIEHVVYVSEKQRAFFKQLGVVIGNGISPAFENMFTSADELFLTKECRGAYTSMPFRGLGSLAEVKELTIDVFSSMQTYQGEDTVFEPMFETLRKNDCLVLRGAVGQAELARDLKRCAFFVYPSVFNETFGIAMFEAMAAGMKVVTTDMASPCTDFIDSTPSTGATSLEDYVKLLRRNVNYFRAHPREWSEKMWEQVQHINKSFTWQKRAVEWENYLLILTKVPETPTST